uniref:Uncharacterized protein n=2 Tax=Spongospora subterranea TaxID=70186 RepID=A0A0H5QL63_9EUKA|eukprot:CRZ02096.1 hypothetical protein [Spongospora subterranea]
MNKSTSLDKLPDMPEEREEASTTEPAHMLDAELDEEIRRLERHQKIERLQQLRSTTTTILTGPEPPGYAFDKVDIPKFDGKDSNFHFWVQNAALYLHAKDLGGIVGLTQTGARLKLCPKLIPRLSSVKIYMPWTV